MAERRMFAKTIIDSDSFLEMPSSAQALYFHLAMRADDDGFVNSPKKIQRMVGASDDDLKLLVFKSFLIPFESGVVVIKHWKIHNYIQADRYKETVYLEEKSMLGLKDNKAYTLMDTECIQNGYILDTQDSIGKNSIDKTSIVKASIDKTTHTREPFAKPTVEEIEEYCLERNNGIDAQNFYDFYESKGWMVGKNKMKDWKASVRTWERNHKDEKKKDTFDSFANYL